MIENNDNNLIVEVLNGEMVPFHEIAKLATSFNSAKEDIRYSLNSAIESFIEIGKNLNFINENKLFKIDDYDNIYEFTEKEFGFSKTLTKNYINVFIRFEDNVDEISAYSHSQIIELLPVSEDLENFSPNMTIKEIREEKKNLNFINVLNKANEERQKFYKGLLKNIRIIFEKHDITVEMKCGNNEERFYIDANFLDSTFSIQQWKNSEYISLSSGKCLRSSFYHRDNEKVLLELLDDAAINEKNSFTRWILNEKKAFNDKLDDKKNAKEKAKEIIEDEKKNFNDNDPLFALNNDEERNEFVRDEKNYLILGEFLGLTFYKFKYLDFGFYKYQNKEFHVKQYFEIVDGVPNIGYNSGVSAIVAAIKSYKQTIVKGV